MAGSKPNVNGPPSGPPRVPTEEELSRLSGSELIRRLRWTEGDRLRRIAEHSNIMRDVTRRMQALKSEAATATHHHQGPAGNDNGLKLQSDNQELRDLCCFLDDDRQKGRNLADEWQRFGRYTASVMRTEVAGYQQKLKELEARQEHLMRENLELKELCFMLDQERGAIKRNSLCSQCNTALSLAPRAQGDGSYDNDMKPETPFSSIGNQRGKASSDNNDELSRYIRQLEDRVHSLEEEKRQLGQASHGSHHYKPVRENGGTYQGKQQIAQKPDSMVRALKVLEVHDKLDHGTPSGSDTEHMNDNHKAIVREMCNVVWRKLGDDPTRQGNEPAPVVPNPSRYPGRPSMGAPGTPPRYSGSTGSLDRKGV